VLTDQLRELEREGIISRVEFGERLNASVFLTSYGLTLYRFSLMANQLSNTSACKRRRQITQRQATCTVNTLQAVWARTPSEERKFEKRRSSIHVDHRNGA
jgi:hypothetical protein